MLARGFWLFEYASISRLLLRAPVQYGRAFLETETDEFDATYFILHQLEVIRRAIEELHRYLQRKMAESRATTRLLRDTDLNHRQVALISHALQHADAIYTVRSHSGSHRVTRQTARTDLQELQALGLLQGRQRGRGVEYFPMEGIRSRIELLGG
jgi:Fic family protein